MKLNEPGKRISHGRPSSNFSRESFASSTQTRRPKYFWFDKKVELLEWKIPRAKKIAKRQNGKFTIVFPASTVGRKGCYELREALGDLNVKLIVLGAELEGVDFWRGIDWEKGGDDWLERADLIVLPAFVEHKPRRLLQAVTNKIPVIASNACGVENVAGVTNVETGDIEQLKNQICASANDSFESIRKLDKV